MNPTPAALPHSFYATDTLSVAQALLGQKIIRRLPNRDVLSGLVVETEAYLGQSDTACHAAKGRTPRTEVMFGPPGRAYVYFVYGMHYLLNVVTEAEGQPCAVLIRAVEPLTGQATMLKHRQGRAKNLSNGPAKLCQALAIDKTFNRWDVTLGQTLWFEAQPTPHPASIASGPRIGINYAAPTHRAAPWRFWLKGNQHVSVTASKS